MIIAITVVHVLTCFILVLIVLLQTGKGADMGAVFGGGSSSTIFGSSGAGNLLTRVTTGAAVVFMVTSLTLAYSAAHRSPGTILDRGVAAEEPEAGPAPQAAIDEEGAGAVPAGEGAGEPPAPAAEEAPKAGTASPEPPSAPAEAKEP